MYAAGRPHPLRAPCGQIIDRVAEGELEAVTSAEVVQEILRRFLSRRQPQVALEMATHALDVFAPVIAVTDVVMRRAIELLKHYDTLPARDLVHAATCLEEGIDAIVTPDVHFDGIRELRRIAPDDAEALAR